MTTTDGVIAPTVQLLDSLFALDPDTQLVGPFNNGDAGTEPLFTRFLMYLPHKYVPLLLATERMTSRQAYERIGGAIRLLGDDEIEACLPLIIWLRIACTKNAMQFPPTALDPPSSPFPVESILVKHRAKILQQDLPGLSVIPTDDVLPGTREVVGAINNLAEEQRISREETNRRQAQAAEKTPTSYFGSEGTMEVLMRYCQVATVPELPRLYRTLARGVKTRERLVIAEEVRNVARDLGCPEYAPLITPDLAKRIGSIGFAHHDIDNLKEGIHPFVTAFRSIASRSQATATINNYDTLMQGTSVQLSDILNLQAADTQDVPTTWLQADFTLRSFAVLLHCLLAAYHALVIAYDDFIRLFTANLMGLEDRGRNRPDLPLKVVRWVQIRISLWFKNQYLSTSFVPPPDFRELINAIQELRAWEPTLPPQLMAKKTPSLGLPDAQVPSGDRTPPGDRNPTGDRNPAGGARERILNTQFQADKYDRYKSLGLSIRAVREAAIAAGKPVPTNGKGTDFCLCFHVLGFCWQNCSRKEDHRTHTADEARKLTTWCAECFRAGL
jgi:hypothetical protein